jgi:hypothetical protein
MAANPTQTPAPWLAPKAQLDGSDMDLFHANVQSGALLQRLLQVMKGNKQPISQNQSGVKE